jgi:hypothetical protein
MSDDPALPPPRVLDSHRRRRRFVCLFPSLEDRRPGGSAGLTVDQDGVSFSFDVRGVSHVLSRRTDQRVHPSRLSAVAEGKDDSP